MTMSNSKNLGAAASRFLQYAFASLALATMAGHAMAQENSIESITASQQGANVIVKIALKNPVAKPPVGFSISNPARIALDFPSTGNNTGAPTQDIGLGDVRNVNVVQAGERSR